ncbi:MAG: Hpt domain-containing protein [Opitutaceae bacterium]
MSFTSSAVSHLAPDVPSLDPERVAMLRELCLDAGDDVMQEIVGSWQTEAIRHMDAAERSLLAADAPKAKAAAHALKGSCANMGVARLAELARLLEIKVGAPGEAMAIVAAMQAEFARARAELAKLGH